MQKTSIPNDWMLVLGIALVCELVGEAQIMPNPDPGSGPTLMGTVFDPAGSTVPGAELVVAQVIKSRTVAGRGPSRVSKSDDHGKFAVAWESVSLGAWVPNAGGYWLIGRDLPHGFAAAVKLDLRGPGGVKSVDLHLQPGFTLSGCVQDSKGAALKSATVQLYIRPEDGSRSRSPDWEVRTDSLGGFSFTALPAGYDYQMSVLAPGYGRFNLPVHAAQTQSALLKLPTVSLKSADKRLEGRVLDADGKAVAMTQVQLVGAEQFPQSTNTDDSGRFIFHSVSDGRVTVYADTTNVTEGGFHPRGGGAQARGGDLNIVIQFK